MNETQLDKHYAKHASRKFIFTILALIAATVLAYFDKLDAVVYRDIVIFIGGIYTAGNVWQKSIETKGKSNDDVKKS